MCSFFLSIHLLLTNLSLILITHFLFYGRVLNNPPNKKVIYIFRKNHNPGGLVHIVCLCVWEPALLAENSLRISNLNRFALIGISRDYLVLTHFRITSSLPLWQPPPTSFSLLPKLSCGTSFRYTSRYRQGESDESPFNLNGPVQFSDDCCRMNYGLSEQQLPSTRNCNLVELDHGVLRIGLRIRDKNVKSLVKCLVKDKIAPGIACNNVTYRHCHCSCSHTKKQNEW